MYKRFLILYGTLMGMFCLSFFWIDKISHEERLYEAAANQQSYKVKIADIRGSIYDCKGNLLVNNKKKLIASAIPCLESLKALLPVVPENKKAELYKKSSGKSPFNIEVEDKVNSPYVKIFEIPVRYYGTPLAPHIIGYLSGDKKGICGIEKAFDKYLYGENHEIYVKYSVDASGKILPGKSNIIEDKSYLMSKGVALNIDSKIQAIASECANKYIKRGAVIVCEVPNCEIRACLSFPSFIPTNVGASLNDNDSPLLNRAFASFNLGSVFKLITSAAALESGINENFTYDCEGVNQVEDAKFKCFNSKKHETVNMEQALAHSCNGYFIELIKKMPYDAVLKMAKKFRLGVSNNLAPEMSSSSGKLPSEESLKDIKTLANFSFGQGKLLASPVQISGVVNTIASGGIYSSPKLIKSLVNEAKKENLKILNLIPKEKEKIISKKNADIIKSHMKASMDYGTSSKGLPENVTAGAKTSTAQTGIIENGKRVEQSWFAGFFPYENPKYTVVILSEDGGGGGESCGPVFKEIAEKIVSESPELFSNPQ